MRRGHGMEDFVRAWLDCYTRGDLEGALRCYTDDVVFEDPLFGECTAGRDALRSLFESFFTSGVTALAFRRWTGSEAGGAVEWEWTARWGAGRTFLGFDVSGQTFVTRGTSVLVLRDGLISAQTDYWDARSALRQVGAWPEPGVR
jgi:steroid delta-isomerase-like uncharacterized protein